MIKINVFRSQTFMNSSLNSSGTWQQKLYSDSKQNSRKTVIQASSKRALNYNCIVFFIAAGMIIYKYNQSSPAHTGLFARTICNNINNTV